MESRYCIQWYKHIPSSRTPEGRLLKHKLVTKEEYDQAVSQGALPSSPLVMGKEVWHYAAFLG